MSHHRRPARAALLVWAAAALLVSGCASVPSASPADTEPAAPATAASAALPDPVVTVAPEAAPVPVPDAAASQPAAMELVPLLPRFRLDPNEDALRGDLWQRVRGGFQLPDLDNELVRKWEQWYARDPAYVQRMTERGGRYLFHIVEELQRREMPGELALLPFIESAFNPQAMSRAAASGMWQFMPGTGKDFELRQNLFRDDRRNVLASTRAALDYLQRLYGMFGDWHLALAAYNWGQGNVTRAIDRNRRAGLPTDYLSLRLPNETREYVPKLQAVKNIVLKPEAFGLALQPLQDHPFFLSVAIERDIDVELAAQLSGLTLEEFQQLNPQMNKPVILAAGTPQVLLPYDSANLFLRGLESHRGALASWTAWVAPKTLKPADAAKLAGVSEAQLREVNHIPPRMLVKAGSTLLVPRGAKATADVSEHIAENGMLAFAPEARAAREVRLKAGRHGDSVAAIAKRYRVSAAQVAQWNGISPQAHFKPGETIRVMLAHAPTRSAKAATPTRKVAKAATPARKKAPASKVRLAAAR